MEPSGLGRIPEYQPPQPEDRIDDHIENFSTGSPTVKPEAPKQFDASKAKAQKVKSTVIIPDEPAQKKNKTILGRVKNALSSTVQFAKAHPWLTAMFVIGTTLILLAFPTVAGAIAGFTGLSILGAHVALTIPYGIMVYYYGIMLINFARNISIKKDYQVKIEQQEKVIREMLTDSIKATRASLQEKQIKVDTIHGKTLEGLDELEQEKRKIEGEIRDRAELLGPIEEARDTTEISIVEKFPAEVQPSAKKMVEETREGIVDGMSILSEVGPFPPSIALEQEIDIPPFPSPAQEKNLPVKKKIGQRLTDLFKPSTLGTVIKEHKLATLIVASGIAVSILAYPLLGAASVFAAIGLSVYGILLMVEGYNLTADNQAKERLSQLEKEGNKQVEQWKGLQETKSKIEAFVPQFKQKQARLIEQKGKKIVELQQKLKPLEEEAIKVMPLEYEEVVQMLRAIDPEANSYPPSLIKEKLNDLHTGTTLIGESVPRPSTPPRER